MKKIDTSAITSTKRQPLFGYSVEHLQNGYIEAMKSLFLAQMESRYTTGDVVILWGMELTGSTTGNGNPFATTAGAVYYNGEIYQVDAASGTHSGSDVLLVTLTTTYHASDPVTFSDNTTGNVHQIQKFVVSSAATGTGTKDWTDLKDAKPVTGTDTDLAGASVGTAGWNDFNSGSITYTTPNDGFSRKYRVTCHAKCSTSNGVVNPAIDLRLRNTTDSATLATSSFGATWNGLSATYPSISGAIVMDTIATIGANKTIKLQVDYTGTSGGNVSVTEVYFSVEEIR